jgi:DNA-binding response OmpR family regulator
MPGMDGVQLGSRLRALDDGARMTIVAVTGWGQDEDRQRTRASGFDHHMTKPVDLGELEALLQATAHRP